MLDYPEIDFVVTPRIIGIISRLEFLHAVDNGLIGDKERVSLISISEPGSGYHDDFYVSGFHDVLEIKFWDIEEAYGSYETITAAQGSLVKEFILTNRDTKFLIHCAAGISRSAGVGRAIECLLNHSGDVYGYMTSACPIMDHYRYSPNYTVFRMIVDQINEGELDG